MLCDFRAQSKVAKHILVPILMLLITTSVTSQQGNPYRSDDVALLANLAYKETHSISSELKDTLVHYTKLIKRYVRVGVEFTDKERYEQYKSLVKYHLYKQEYDSIELLSKRFNMLNVGDDYKIIFQRVLGKKYDHENNSAKAMEYFFSGLEMALAEKDSLCTDKLLWHMRYIIQNRLPINHSWVKRKEELYKDLLLTYDLKNQPVHSFEITFRSPDYIIKNVLPKKSNFFPTFEKDIAFVKRNLNTINELKYESSSGKSQKSGIIKNYEETLTYFNDKHKKNNLYYNLVHSYVQYLIEIQDYSSASFYANELDKILDKDIGPDYFDYSSFYHSAALAHKNTKAFQESLYYTELQHKYQTENSRNMEKTYEYIVQHLNTLKQAKMELLWTKNQKRTSLMITAGLIILSLILCILYLTVTNSKKLLKSRNNALKVIEEKNELETRLELLENTISKDLYDNFGNKLTGITHSFEIMNEIIENENLNSKLFSKFKGQFENTLSELTGDMNDFLWVNNPNNNTVNKLIHRLTKHTKNDIEIKTYTDFKRDLELPKLWGRQLFLIFKEAIENASKHAKATEIKLRFYTKSPNTLIVEAKDNGQGFKVDKANMLPGMDNMYKRAKSIRGNLNIVSSKDVGTTVTFVSQEFKM